jgi:hypothetical protein
MIVFAVDPGKASGVALMSWEKDLGEEPELNYSAEVQPEDFAAEIRIALGFLKHSDPLYIACESFTINAQTAKNSQAPWSLENIGVLKHLCREAGYDPSNIAFQPPVNAKNMFPNPTLKKLGYWHKGGEGHANDAIRHALLRLVKAGWSPVRLLTPES